jgi:hypothetical protein
MFASRIDLLLDLIDSGYDRTAWHGPNLRGSIRRVKEPEARQRPAAGRKTIAEHVVHAAYWKYAVRRLLRGDARGSFPIKGSNWFEVDDIPWSECIALLNSEHRLLRIAVAEFPEVRLDSLSPKKKYRCVDIITGIAAHDVYHAGQIQLIRRLLSS